MEIANATTFSSTVQKQPNMILRDLLVVTYILQ